MKNPLIAIKWLLLISAGLVILLSGCKEQPATPPVKYSLPELKYQLISYFGDVFWCDPDLYPVARPEQEEKNATEQFPTIEADKTELSAILQHLGLPDKLQYTNEEKLQIYREHKRLTIAVQMTLSGNIYDFILRIGEGQGERIEGTITSSSEIKVTKREPSSNTCPICLAKGTIIDTPDGPVLVEQLRQGMSVWTADLTGKRTPAVVVKTGVTQVPSSFQILRITLNDGRALTASAGHPTAEGRALGNYELGDTLDGTLVIAVEQLSYDGFTYDIVPSGGTGLYWANGVLLKSTLKTD